MALETLKDVKELGGYNVLSERPKNSDGSVDWKSFDELRKNKPIYVDRDVNMISFRIQNGSIKENGVNGCQVDTLIHTAKHMLEGLNSKFPCEQNGKAIVKLQCALDYLELRKKDREKRGVEGFSKA